MFSRLKSNTNSEGKARRSLKNGAMRARHGRGTEHYLRGIRRLSEIQDASDVRHSLQRFQRRAAELNRLAIDSGIELSKAVNNKKTICHANSSESSPARRWNRATRWRTKAERS